MMDHSLQKSLPTFSPAAAQGWPGRLEYGFTVVTLFLYISTFVDLVLSGGRVQQNSSVSYDSSLGLLAFMATYLVVGLLVLARWQTVWRSLRGDLVILPLVGFACLSYFWSDAPEVTLRRLIALTGTSMFGLYLASRYSLRQQLHLLAAAFGLVVVLSYVFALALPGYGVMSGLHDGAWRGVFMHKNGLGMKMVISGLVFFLLALGEQRRRWLYGLGFFASALLLLLSESGTAIVSLVVVLLLVPVYHIFTLRGTLKITWGLLAVLTAVSLPAGYVLANLAQILGLIGKDMTFTGRMDIWPIVVRSIAERPWLGYGYEAFWRGLHGPSAAFTYTGLVGATHAHNGILQLWLSLGFVGVVVFVCGFWLTALRAVHYLHADRTLAAHWPIGFLTILVFINVAESNILDYNDIIWVLFCTVALSLSSRAGDRSLRPSEPGSLGDRNGSAPAHSPNGRWPS